MNTHGKGALHYQEITAWSKKPDFKQGRAKLIDPPSDNPFLGCQVFGRTYMEQNASNALVMTGEAGAEIWFAKFKPQYERAKYIEAWECPNEFPVGSAEQRRMAVRFLLRWETLMHAAGYKTVELCTSVSWPHTEDAMEFAPVLATASYLGLHEYGYPRMQTDQVGTKCLHYRQLVAAWKTGGVKRIPPILITECGEDDGQGHGWKTATNHSEPAFLADLQWYADEVGEDDYLLAFLVFTAGPQGWGDFEVTESLGRAIASPTAFVPPVVVVPPPTPAPIPIGGRLITPLLLWPLGAVAGKITQEFGCDLRWGTSSVDYSWVKTPMPNGQVLSMAGHNGRDIAAPLGTPIYAMHAGVCWVYDDPGGYGLTVEIWDPKIDGGSAFKTIYGHMSKQVAIHGQPVAAGALIGLMGSTGNSTGVHTHTGLKLLQGNCPAYRGWIDPKPFMDR